MYSLGLGFTVLCFDCLWFSVVVSGHWKEEFSGYGVRTTLLLNIRTNIQNAARDYIVKWWVGSFPPLSVNSLAPGEMIIDINGKELRFTLILYTEKFLHLRTDFSQVSF